MQIYYEQNYPSCDDAREIIKKSFLNFNKNMYEFYFKKIENECGGYFGDWEDFYYCSYYDICNKIAIRIKKDQKKSILIIKKLVLKKFLRSYINYIRYRPGGSGYQKSKEHFIQLKKRS